MSKQKVRGIVIEAKNKGENDKWLTVLCKGIGKISVKARGCRKPNSRLFACTALFAYCDFIVDDHMRFYQLSSGDIIKNFFVGCDDIKTLSLANYFIEITNRMLKHGQEDDRFMYFLLKGLQALDKKINDIRSIGYIFEIRALVTEGFMPYMDGCINCGGDKAVYFHPEGMVCENCASKENIKLLPDTRAAIEDISATDVNDVFKLEFSPAVQKQLSDCARLMMHHYLDVSFHTYNLINYMKWY